MAFSQPITKLEKQNQGLFNQQLVAKLPPVLTNRCIWLPLPFDFIAHIKDGFVCIFQITDLPFISEPSFKNLTKAVQNNNDDAKKEKRAARCALPLHVIEHENVQFIITLSENLFATVSNKEVKIWKIESTKNIPLKIDFVIRFKLFNIGNIRNVKTTTDDRYLCGLHSTANTEIFWALDLVTGVLKIKNCPCIINNSELVCLSDNSLAIVGERDSAGLSEYCLLLQLNFDPNRELSITIEEQRLVHTKIKRILSTPDKQFWIVLDAENRLSLWLPPKTNEAAVKLFECQLLKPKKIEILPNGSIAILHNDGMLNIFNPYKANQNMALLINYVNDFIVMPSGKLLAFRKDGSVLQVELHAVINHFKHTKNALLNLVMDTIPTLPKVLALLTLEYNQTTPYSPQEALRIPRFLPEPLQCRMMRLFYHAQTCPEAKAATEYLCAGLESKTETPATWAKNATRLFETRHGALTAPLRETLIAVSELKF